MKLYTFVLSTCFLLFACKKSGGDTKETVPPKEPSTLTVLSGEKSFQLTIKSESSKFTDTSYVKLTASSPEIEVYLQAASGDHKGGVGNYFLWCCANKTLEKSSGVDYNGIKEPTDIGTFGTQKGALEILKLDEKGYEGKFTFYGKSTLGVEKEFTGSFKVIF